jgi:predicted TIM-barrel fold metal-dependent hydrolase
MQMMHPEDRLEVRSLGVEELDEKARAAAAALPPLVSVDSHVMEPDALWEQLSPAHYKSVRATLDVIGFGEQPLKGAGDPHARLLDQDRDGVAAEVLFPNNGMAIFGIEDIGAQREAMKLYNDFLADFCKVAPNRFYGVPAIPVYDIDVAIAEMHRALDMGLTGIMVWQVPDPRLPFMSDHYDRLWAAAAEAGAPVHLHILTGHTYFRDPSKRKGAEKIRGSVNQKTHDMINSLFDIIFSGAFDRHPKMRLVLAESECGWLPFILQQWDYYFERFRNKESFPIDRKPSEIFNEHVYCTWLEDYSGSRQFTWWGQNNLMWSNDYPHPNMTFPYSRENIIRHIGNLPRDLQLKLVRDNALRLYGFKLN